MVVVMGKVGMGMLVLLWHLTKALLTNEVTTSGTFWRSPYWREANVADPAKRWLTAFDMGWVLYGSII